MSSPRCHTALASLPRGVSRLGVDAELSHRSAIRTKVGMPPQLIRFYGTYRYDSPASLDRAISSAQAQLEDEEAGNPAVGSLRGLVKHGASLRAAAVALRTARVGFESSTRPLHGGEPLCE